MVFKSIEKRREYSKNLMKKRREQNRCVIVGAFGAFLLIEYKKEGR